MSKKIVIPRETLPAPDIGTGTYQIRYRIVSDDKNRISAWSPIYTIDPGFIYTATGSISLSKATGTTSAVWPAVTVKKGATGTPENIEGYDVWIRWHTGVYGAVDSGTWVYYGKVYGTSTTISVPAGMSYFSIEVYRPGTPIQRSQSNGFNVYSSYDYLAV
jgi:hypothetical protein